MTEFGDGELVACHLQRSPYCLWILDEDTVSADRIVPKVDGGTYERKNLQPGCPPCQSDQGGELGVRQKARLRGIAC